MSVAMRLDYLYPSEFLNSSFGNLGGKRVRKVRIFFDWLGDQLGNKSMEDWYSVTHQDLAQYGGLNVLKSKFNNSMVEALPNIYPEHNWLMWRFGGRVSDRF